MRTNKTISLTVPSAELKAMERVAKRENRTVSELLGEAFRRYVATPQAATLGDALRLVRDDARNKSAKRVTQREINAEIAAYRMEQRGRKKLKRPA
jgi:hypothetical protein